MYVGRGIDVCLFGNELVYQNIIEVVFGRLFILIGFKEEVAEYGINGNPELVKRLGFPEGFTCVGTMALGYADREFPKIKADEQRIEVTYIR